MVHLLQRLAGPRVRCGRLSDVIAARLTWAALAVSLLVLAGCDGKVAAPAGQPTPSTPSMSVGSKGERADTGPATLVAAVEGLCQVLRDADRGVPLARAVFYDRSHDGLHDLAATVATKDRVAAARLLEAKSAVERDYDNRKRWPRLEADLTRLRASAVAALIAIGLEPPACAR
jgi:hypothetical protein